MPRTAVRAPFGDDDQHIPPDSTSTHPHEPADDRPIEMLDLSVRAYNCLKRAGITTIGDLLALSRDALWRVRSWDERSHDETRAKLIEMGMMTTDHPIGPFRE